jgi:hypothetical protein
MMTREIVKEIADEVDNRALTTARGTTPLIVSFRSLSLISFRRA